MNKTINELINTQKSDLNILGAPDRKWSTFGNLKTLSSVCQFAAKILWCSS